MSKLVAPQYRHLLVLLVLAQYFPASSAGDLIHADSSGIHVSEVA
jgi:hypothetical protein